MKILLYIVVLLCITISGISGALLCTSAAPQLLSDPAHENPITTYVATHPTLFKEKVGEGKSTLSAGSMHLSKHTPNAKVRYYLVPTKGAGAVLIVTDVDLSKEMFTDEFPSKEILGLLISNLSMKEDIESLPSVPEY